LIFHLATIQGMDTVEGEQSAEPQVERWGFESHFQEYALLLAKKGKDGLESIDNFPQRIELNDEWHRTLEKIRLETEDGLERGTLTGFPGDMRKLTISDKLVVGKKASIKFLDSLENAKQKHGIDKVVGTIHSHPGHWDSPEKRYIEPGRSFSEYRGFTTKDFHTYLKPSYQSLFIDGVVDSQVNYFVFLTKDTKFIPKDSKLYRREIFEDYWLYQQTKSLRTFSLWDVDMAIAKEYKLALYRGNSGEDLIRYFP